MATPHPSNLMPKPQVIAGPAAKGMYDRLFEHWHIVPAQKYTDAGYYPFGYRYEPGWFSMELRRPHIPRNREAGIPGGPLPPPVPPVAKSAVDVEDGFEDTNECATNRLSTKKRPCEKESDDDSDYTESSKVKVRKGTQKGKGKQQRAMKVMKAMNGMGAAKDLPAKAIKGMKSTKSATRQPLEPSEKRAEKKRAGRQAMKVMKKATKAMKKS